MKINIPDNAKTILDTIHNAGFEAYVVGGCVRDALLGRIPGDWDITTNALPDKIKKLFKRTVDTGIQHGTVTVMMGREGYEVTTYRIDGKYEDSRHPTDVSFTTDLLEDMKRRDFTINAMAYNDKEGLIDRFDGIRDLKDGIIRCVGQPCERFSEDALRIMRAVRFAAQLGFEIDEGTKKAMKELSPTLKKISAERIQAELIKLLLSDHPERLKTAYELGITSVFMPEFDRCMETEQNNPHHMYSVGEHTICAIKNVRPDRILRLSMLFHDIGKPVVISVDEAGVNHFYGHEVVSTDIARDIFRRLKFDSKTMDRVCNLVRYHDERYPARPGVIRKAINTVGEQDFPLLLEVRYADIMAQSMYKREEKLDLIVQTREIYDKIIEDGDCVSLKDLAVRGNDLIEMGIKPGKALGDILQRMLLDVLDDPKKNTREYLLDPDRLEKRYMRNSHRSKE